MVSVKVLLIPNYARKDAVAGARSLAEWLDGQGVEVQWAHDKKLYPDKVVDTTGMFFIEGTDEPYEYNGHFSWMPVLNNQCVDNINGEQVTIFDWISRQSRG